MFNRIMSKAQKKDFNTDQDVTVYDYHGTLKFMFVLYGFVDGHRERPWFMIFSMAFVYICGIVGISLFLFRLQITIQKNSLSEATEVVIYLIMGMALMVVQLQYHFFRSRYRRVKDDLEEAFVFISTPEGRKYRKSFYETQLVGWQVCSLWTITIFGIMCAFFLKCNLDLALFYVLDQEEGATRPLLLPLGLPPGFDRGQTPYFEVLFVFQYATMLAFTQMFLPLHYLTMLSVGHLLAQLDMVISELEVMFVDLPEVSDQAAVRQELKERVKRSVDWHVKACDYFDNWASIYGPINAYSQMITTPLVCIIAYVVANDLDEHKVNYLMLMLFVGSVTQYLVPCWGITIIGTKFSEVGEVCARCEWWGRGAAGRAAARDVRVVLARSQRPLPDRVPGFRSLNLEEYLRSMTQAYSYFNMLRQLNP